MSKSSQFSSIAEGGCIKPPIGYNSRSYASQRGEEQPFQICAENIQYVTTFLDPKKRILKEMKLHEFKKSDYKAINAYIRKRGSLDLGSDEDLGEGPESNYHSLASNELVRRDIAYFIRGI